MESGLLACSISPDALRIVSVEGRCVDSTLTLGLLSYLMFSLIPMDNAIIIIDMAHRNTVSENPRMSKSSSFKVMIHFSKIERSIEGMGAGVGRGLLLSMIPHTIPSTNTSIVPINPKTRIRSPTGSVLLKVQVSYCRRSVGNRRLGSFNNFINPVKNPRSIFSMSHILFD